MRQGDKEEKAESKVEVDEQWKRAVAEEKERLRQHEGVQPPRNASEAAPRSPLPQPTMEIFIAGLYTQTLIALGDMPHPATGRKETDTDEAAHLIDTIAMLQSKTQGNLTSQESSYMRNVLTNLRMRYVRAAESPRPAPTGQPGGEQA